MLNNPSDLPNVIEITRLGAAFARQPLSPTMHCVHAAGRWGLGDPGPFYTPEGASVGVIKEGGQEVRYRRLLCL